MEIRINNNPIEYSKAIEEMELKHTQVLNDGEELVWLLEHDDVYTAGISANDDELLTNEIPVFKTKRGGKFTYHGHGQQICYFILNLKNRSQKSTAKVNCRIPDVRCFVSCLEDVIINALAKVGILGEKRKDRIGVWVVNNHIEQKIAAIGVKFSKGVTTHGFAINVSTNLQKFNGIVPCGIADFGVCSIESCGVKITLEDFQKILIEEIQTAEEKNFYQTGCKK